MFSKHHWIRRYTRQQARDDALAALIVTVMLIPQSLAYAMLAGLPAQVGLYASILPLIAYAALGSSMTLAVGPVAVISLMTASSVGAIAASGTTEYLAGTITLAVMSGLFMLMLGFLRAGFLASLLSHPVINGFISASAILIAASQLKHLLGIEGAGHTLVEISTSLANHLDQIHTPTLAVGTACVLMLLLVRSHLSKFLIARGLSPELSNLAAKLGPMFAVIGSTLWVAQGPGDIAIVGVVPAGLPIPSLPSFSWSLVEALWPAAVLISLVGFVESVSVGHTLAAKRRERIDPNRELMGLGAANLASGLGGGFPVTGGFSRSVVNYDAGARTPMAGVITAALIALTALFLTEAFYFLPKAVLAATVIVAVLTLVDLRQMRSTLKYSRGDAAAMGMTFVVVLALGVEAGILAGVACSIVCLIGQIARPHIAELGQVAKTEHYRNVDRFTVEQTPTAAAIRFDERLNFLNAQQLENQVAQLIERPSLANVVLHCGAINQIDISGLEALESINERLKFAGVDFHLSEVKGPVMDSLQRTDFFDHLTGGVHMSHHQAMQAVRAG